MVYLDTGCLVKLYYPERESAAVAAAVMGERIAFTALHELEIVTAMHLKVFRGEATSEQVVAATRLGGVPRKHPRSWTECPWRSIASPANCSTSRSKW